MKYEKRIETVEAFQWLKNGDHPLDGDPANEGDFVRYYRHPQFPGQDECSGCGFINHVHGWIDRFDRVICPGDYISFNEADNFLSITHKERFEKNWVAVNE